MNCLLPRPSRTTRRRQSSATRQNVPLRNRLKRACAPRSPRWALLIRRQAMCRAARPFRRLTLHRAHPLPSRGPSIRQPAQSPAGRGRPTVRHALLRASRRRTPQRRRRRKPRRYKILGRRTPRSNSRRRKRSRLSRNRSLASIPISRHKRTPIYPARIRMAPSPPSPSACAPTSRCPRIRRHGRRCLSDSKCRACGPNG